MKTFLSARALTTLGLLSLSRALISLPLQSFSALAPSNLPPPTEEQEANQNKTLSFGMVVFHGFEPLDVWGPLELLYMMSDFFNISLSVISHELGVISSRAPHKPAIIGPAINATHTFEDAPALDIVLVPGGGGIDYLYTTNNTDIQDFLNLRYDDLEYVMSVCTGAYALASAGLLDGRRATTSKLAWSGVTSLRPQVDWMPSARWVEDGKIWTSSGVTAGIDMMYAFLKGFYGAREINGVMNAIEFVPHTDPHWDPFSIVHDVPGADPDGDMEDCFSPVEMDGPMPTPED